MIYRSDFLDFVKSENDYTIRFGKHIINDLYKQNGKGFYAHATKHISYKNDFSYRIKKRLNSQSFFTCTHTVLEGAELSPSVFLIPLFEKVIW